MQVIVIGAGIFGVTTARSLEARGHRVTLVDPGPIPHPDAASTDVSKAVRMDYADPFYMDLMLETFPGWDAWNRDEAEPLYHQDGFLILSAEPLAPGSFARETLRLLTERGYPPERLDRPAIRDRFPAFSTGHYLDGYFNPRAGWAESSRVVSRLLAGIRERGVTVRESRVTGLVETGSRISGVRLEGEEIGNADCVVVAAGAHSPDLVPELRDGVRATAQPVLHFAPADPDRFRPPRFPVWAAELATEGWYGFPARPDGTVKVANHQALGRTVDPSAPREIAPEQIAAFREFLGRALPELAEAPIATSRVCLYTDVWDGNFLIDHVPGRPGLVVATGGSGHAFKFAPILGDLVARVVEGTPDPRTARFAWRAHEPGVDTPRK